MSNRFETSENLPKYFQEISAVADFMTKEEEKALADRIQNEDCEALNKLVESNLKYVVTIANKFIGMGLPIDDLIQEGNNGLIEAARRFTSDRDTKFLTYAKFWIRKRLNLALCEHGRTVRIPVNQEYEIYKRKMKGDSDNLSNVRIDNQVGEDGNSTIGDIMLRQEFNDPFEGEDDRLILQKLLASLKSTELKVVELFYGLEGDGMSTKEVADAVGKTPAEVNRILKIARSKMRRRAGL